MSDKYDELVVTWDALAPPGPLCPITSYKVTWRSDDGDNGSQDTGTTDNTFTITGLHPCTSYTVSVTAENINGFGVASDEVTGDTLAVGRLDFSFLFCDYTLMLYSVNCQICIILTFCLDLT